MPVETLERPVVEPRTDGVGMDGLFGKCPVCGIELAPKDRWTREPKIPTSDGSTYSRMCCSKGCMCVIQYMGIGNWVWTGYHVTAKGKIKKGKPK